MAEVWAERDPGGFHDWIRQRFGNFTLREVG